MVLAEAVSDGTLISIITALGAFTASLIWWVLKSQDRRHQEDIKLRTREVVAQESTNQVINKLSDELHNHMISEEKRSEHHAQRFDAFGEKLDRNTESVDRLVRLMEKRETGSFSKPNGQ